MKIVIICMDCFPDSGACTNLIKKLLNYGFAQGFDEVHYIAATLGCCKKDAEMWNGQIIHRVTDWKRISTKTLLSSLSRDPLFFMRGAAIRAGEKIRIKLKKRELFSQRTAKDILKKLEEINCGENDVVIPIAADYSTVKAALQYAKRVKTNVIVYQVDPCSSNINYAGIPKVKLRKFEDEMFEGAQCVVTTPILYDEMKGYLKKSYLEKAIPMEFPGIDVRSCWKNPVPSVLTDETKCLFTGQIYAGVRNPEYTLLLFSALKDKNITLDMVGTTEQQIRKMCNIELDSNINFYGTLSVERTREFISQADVLVNIGNIVKNQVPSKIFEYISSGKPIVSICKNEDDPTITYLERYPFSLCLFENEDFDQQVESLRDFLRNTRGCHVLSVVIENSFETCTAKYCACRFQNIIMNVRN